uniref:DNA methyltransferase n=1 Tax=Alistipes sp. D31t1_170403_E11 TaxID=2787128 RepID=UPI0018981302|nr:DNA methyltransferase [Alistipes sp. D31t1_170403_E11]
MIFDSTWEFKDVNTKYATHGFHNYPATMIPQIANKLIAEYGISAKTLFDPYCGTGTSLVEANLRGINAIGTDINPLARLISESKTTIIEQQTVDLYIKEFNDYLFQYRYGFKKKDLIFNKFQNIDYWFAQYVQEDLEIIKRFIEALNDKSIRSFFEVAFSQTIRDCSWTRNDEFKLYRMPADKMKTFHPNVFETMENILAKNRLGLLDYANRKQNQSQSIIYDFNTVDEIPTNIIPQSSIDLIVTSPPYGDSRTTVAYGQFSRLTCQWLGINNANKIDTTLMGGRQETSIKQFKSDTLNQNIEAVSNIDRKRALEVVSFYTDYDNSIRNISEIVKSGGYVCYVVSNRCVKGITMETDLITKDFFENYGFKYLDTFRRRIANKRMPRQNSPTGKSGEKRTLMNYESIVIMKKR